MPSTVGRLSLTCQNRGWTATIVIPPPPLLGMLLLAYYNTSTKDDLVKHQAQVRT